MTLISANLENTRNVHASSLAKDWWQDRGFDPQFIAANLKSYVLLESPQQLENLDCVKQMSIEEKYLTGIWKPHAITGKLDLQWISKDYLALFFCWNYLPNPVGNQNLVVTGIRARCTSKGPTQNPKEVTLGIKHIKALDGYPASLGYYGLLVPKVKETTHTSWSQLHGCQGFTVILTEGCCDMLAGRHLIRGSNTI
ncbi:hypothetical protein [Fluviispira multicolorata]|uniref:Uncharacterized protein n=1 Tax=Fluviispira multicolorata TaxID=2654512 RepID=A0A833N3G9_9BACT|nr:hypothetical protein [Fluviispira multicolorata]KAB8029879.1 hypothetical protein GCL57_10095 [Fluviispira multicolorata]